MRNRWIKYACTGLVAAPTLGVAQERSNVSISGIIDAGITYVHGQHGPSSIKFDSGIFTPNLLTIKGTEDLGGGSRALFELTSQFDMGNGQTIPGAGQIFGRTAIVGISKDRLGTVTLGNQYDFMFDSLSTGRFDGAFMFGGLYDWRQGPFSNLGVPQNPTGSFDFDRMAGATRVANSVKYRSPELGGFRLGGLYGFGENSSSFSANSTTSFGVNYDSGPWAFGAAYVNVKYPELGGHEGIRNYGLGAHYQFPDVLAMLLYTNTRNTLTGAAINVYKAGAFWDITATWKAGINYAFMDGNATLNSNRAHQVTGALQYQFSKRTLAYVEAVYQHAQGSNGEAHAWINGLLQPDSAANGNSQMLTRIGIATRF